MQVSSQDGQVRVADQQDIRLAVVLKGGVSLAVWISGVAIELHRLVQASRRPRAERADDAYSGLLDVLQATARVDVISGTSAGGLNGGFLSLGLLHGCDLQGMRKLWADKGDLAALLRDPRSKDNPSLLRGDYFHSALKDAYRAIASNTTGRPASGGTYPEHVELFLTGTLWRGRTSPFTDALGRLIVEVDHDAIFHFSSRAEDVVDAEAGDLREPTAVAPQLAVASRCTSSFPGAFEPFKVEVKTPYGDRWNSTAGLANFGTTQYVVDGGVLLNKPIRPALDAVYRQPANRQVRRVMAYVVPDPSEGTEEITQTDESMPMAPKVLLGVLTRLRSTDSVSVELAEIERRNDSARQRRRTRDRVASALAMASDANDFIEDTYPAYRDVRLDSAATTIGELLSRRGRALSWSRRELTAVMREVAHERDGLPFVPPPDLDEALGATGENWRWGQSEVNRLGDLTVDVFKRAVWLAQIGSDERAKFVEQRDQVHKVISDIRRNNESLEKSWISEGEGLPPRGKRSTATQVELQQLRRHLDDAVTGWEGGNVGQRRVELLGQARALAACLYAQRTALQVVAQRSSPLDPDDEERDRLAGLVSALVAGATAEQQVLQRMLRLQVLHVAFAGATTEIEQEVELFQVSSQRPELLTGIQEHHFGAFYRASWRMNDWMRGRLDGAAQVVQMLMSPERLRQVGHTAETAYNALQTVAVGPESVPYAAALQEAWNRDAEALKTELAVLDGTGALPRTLPLVANRIAARLHTQMLPEELLALAQSIESETDPLPRSNKWAQDAKQQLDRSPTMSTVLHLAEGSEVVGRQRIRAEIPEGTDTFARTAAHGLATFTSMISARKPRPVRATLSALRGYAVLVWVLVNSLTTGSNIGRNVISLTLGVGGALLGLTLVVPGVPIGVTLIGALLVLASATATTLAKRRQYGWLGWRLLVPVVIVLLALAADLWWTVVANADDRRDTLIGGLASVGVVFAVVLLGWFVARARPPSGTTNNTGG